MIFTFIVSLVSWLPPILRVIVLGALAFLLISVLLRLIAFILDLIPFV